MPRQSPAKLSVISSLPPPESLPKRLRLVGRVISWNSHNCTTVIVDDGVALLVDVTLSTGTNATGNDIGNNEGGYRPRIKDLVMVTGDLCLNIPKVSAPSIDEPVIKEKLRKTSEGIFVIPKSFKPRQYSGPTPNLDLILRAHSVVPCEDLDLPQWREAVKVLEIAMAESEKDVLILD